MRLDSICSFLNIAPTRFSLKAVASYCQIAILACLPLVTQITPAHSESALAFGYDSNNRAWFGSAYNHKKKEEARRAAMERCVQQGPQCEVVLEAANACVALAIGDDSNASGRAKAATEAQAQGEALQICVEYNKGNSCSIRESFCDVVSEEAVQTPTQPAPKPKLAEPRPQVVPPAPEVKERREPAAAPELQKTPPSPAPAVTIRDCDNCPELVVVGKGQFTMGSDESPLEKPQHTVKVGRSFAIGRYEVTFAEWDQCVDAGACRNRPNDYGWGRERTPVIDVSWDDTAEYVKWLSQKTGQVYRLPTEAEWEYAARGGTSSSFWWGREKGAGNANCSDCAAAGGAATKPKLSKGGSFQPNPYGIYDTSGNAAEWVQDCWNDNYKGAPSDGSAWLDGNCRQRVLRGGSFGSKAQSARSSARFRYDSDVRYYANGFRVVREMPQ